MGCVVNVSFSSLLANSCILKPLCACAVVCVLMYMSWLYCYSSRLSSEIVLVTSVMATAVVIPHNSLMSREEEAIITALLSTLGA